MASAQGAGPTTAKPATGERGKGVGEAGKRSIKSRGNVRYVAICLELHRWTSTSVRWGQMGLVNLYISVSYSGGFVQVAAGGTDKEQEAGRERP